MLAGLFFILNSGAPLAQAVASPTPPDALTYLTDFQVRTITPPARDEYAIDSRLSGDGSKASPARTTTKTTYKLGDQESFWVFDLDSRQYYQVRGTLVAITDHVYMFLDNSYRLNVTALQQAANGFEQKIYPTNRRYFGEEWVPGVDGDPHLLVLNTPLRLAAGYFSSKDELLRTINNKSNEREMFYVGSSPDNLNNYLSLLAHEFQHMIHWYNQPNQDIWLNEGASVLAQTLNGFSSSNYESAFWSRPTTQLNSWSCLACSIQRHYGAGYLWLSYLEDNYDFESVRSLITNGHGLTGFNAVNYGLARYKTYSPDLTSDSVFQNWILANYLNRRTADPLYSYRNVNGQVSNITATINQFPTNRTDTTPQYSAQYYQVKAGADGFTLDFSGSPTVAITGAKTDPGEMVWWTNKGDNSDSTLTHDFDLSNIRQATLKFRLWFDIEPKYDNLYLLISNDDGKTWKPQSSKYTSNNQEASTSKNYGPAYTGRSTTQGFDLTDTDNTGGEWVQEEVDLSKYAGQKIKVRFEYLTDEGYSRQGALLDNFEIPQIGWKDSAQDGENGWQANGFIRHNNQLPQKYAVRVVRRDGPCGATTTENLATANNSQSCILDLTLDATNAGKLKVPFQDALVVVAPYATKTLVPAPYTLNFTR